MSDNGFEEPICLKSVHCRTCQSLNTFIYIDGRVRVNPVIIRRMIQHLLALGINALTWRGGVRQRARTSKTSKCRRERWRVFLSRGVNAPETDVLYVYRFRSCLAATMALGGRRRRARRGRIQRRAGAAGYARRARRACFEAA